MDAHVLVRRTFRERMHVRLALAVGAAMEDLAALHGGDPEAWELAGLLADLDREALRENPASRGTVAADMLRSERAPADLLHAVRDRWCSDPPTPFAAALAVASPVCEAVMRIIADGQVALDQLSTRQIERRLGLDPQADARLQRALRRLGMDLQQTAALCLQSIRRTRADLGVA